LELVIKPGKEFKELFTLTNLAGDTIITPKIVYFKPDGDFGNVTITEDDAPEWVIYNKEPFNLKSQEKLNFQVMFSPPTSIDETDHFLTLVFETNEPVDLLGQSSSTYKSRIGANILLTISEDGNPKKSAEIVEFKASKFIDPLFGKVSYQVRIKNSGNSFWKPIGKITTDIETLKLAPQNVLSGNTRGISCVDNETLKKCELNKKFFLGKIISKLEFSLDEESKVYTAETVTYVFPISILTLTITLLTIIKPGLIFKLWSKEKN